MNDVETQRVSAQPLKAIFLKELRGALWWNGGALAALSVVLGVMLYLYRDDVSYSGIGLHQEDVRATWLISVSLVGLILGILSWAFDVGSGRWGLMVQRSATRRQWFVGKTAAGLTGYAVATLVPLAVAAAWCAKPGNVSGPFYPAMVLPPLVNVAAGVIAYFAGALSVMAPGRWRVGHVFWIPAAGALIALSVAVTTLAVALVVIALGITLFAWTLSRYVMARRRREVGWATRGVTGLCFGFNLFALAFFAVTLVVEVSRVSGEPRRRLTLLDDGTPVWVTYGRGDSVTAVTTEGEDLGPVIRDSQGYRRPGPTLASRSWLSVGKPGTHWRSLADHYRVVSDLSRERGIGWYFDVAEARFVGYDVVERRPVRQLGEEGFAGWSREVGGAALPSPVSFAASAPNIVVSGSRVLRVNFANERVATLFKDPEGQALPPLTSFDSQAGLRREADNGGKLFSALAFGQRLVLISRDLDTISRLASDADYTAEFDVSIPEAVAATGSVRWWSLIDGRFVLASQGGADRDDRPAVRLSATGETLSRFTLPTDPRGSDRLDAVIGVVATPPVLSAFMGVTENVPRNQREMILGIAAAVSLLGGLLAAMMCWQRDGKVMRGSVGWVVLGLLTGPLGILTWLCIAPRPARMRCADCGRPRTACGETCARCDAAFAPPARIGTELFA